MAEGDDVRHVIESFEELADEIERYERPSYHRIAGQIRLRADELRRQLNMSEVGS